MAKKDKEQNQNRPNNPDEMIVRDELVSEETATGKKLNWVSFAVLLLLVVIAVGYYESNQYNRATSVIIGGAAPAFGLINLQNYDVELIDYAGKVVIVNFWATWCKPCEEEIPSLVAMYNGFKRDDLVVLAISIDKDKGAAELSNYAIAHNMNFQVLMDPKSSVAKRYGTTGVPESFIISRKGNVIKKYTGAVDWTDPAVIELLQGELLKPAK